MTTPMPVFDRTAVLAEMANAWDEFERRRGRVSDAALTGPADAAGWTGKDHLMHLVCWGNAAYDMLEGIPRWRSFWIPHALYRGGDFDAINAVLRDRYVEVPLVRIDLYLAVMRRRATQAMTNVSADAALRPYGRVAPEGMADLQEAPLLRFLLGTQTRHLLAHMACIESLVEA